jgi:REP element-mobilizing transposase RayT
MPQSLAKVAVHLVFSTKNRQRWLQDANVRRELFAYMATILQEMDCTPILINGVDDHVHLLFLLSRNHAIKKVVEAVKTEPSKWVKRQGPQYRDFYWQNGYSIFSVSQSKIEAVRKYIANQESHHRRMSFQEELREICARHGVEIDERYVWD